MNPAGNGHKRPRTYQKHGHYRRQRALKSRSIKAIDGRTREGKRAFKLRSAIVSDIGGSEMLTEGKSTALDLLIGIFWDIGDIEAWKREHRAKYGTIVNRRTKSLPPVVQQEQKLTETGIKLLDKIYDGSWKRVARDLPDLAQQLARLNKPTAPEGQEIGE